MLKKTLAVLLPCASLMAAVFTENFDKGIKGWGTWNAPVNKCTYEFDKNQGCAAPGCAVIRFKEGNDPNKYPVFIRRFPGLEAGTYCFTAKYKAVGNGVSACLTVQTGKEEDKNGKQIWTYKGKLAETIRKASAEEWHTMTATFDVKAGSIPQLLPGAKGPAGTSCMFDDITLEKVDFDKGFKDSFDSQGWSIWRGNTKDKIKMVYIDAEGHQEKGAVSLQIEESNPAHKSACLLRRFPATPGQEYTLIVFTKSADLPDNATISLAIQGQDNKNLFIPGLTPKSTKIAADQCRNWKRLALTFKIPTTGRWAKCANLLVTLGCSTTQTKATILFDDFQYFRTVEED